MKKVIIAAAVCLATFGAKAQQNPPSAIDSIQTTISFYFDGWGTGDTTKLGKAMHATCHLKSFADGVFNDIPRADYLSRFKPRTRPATLVTRIVSIDVTGNIAGAKTEIITETMVFTDYFNLIRTNEGWFIADKIAVRRAK